MKHICKICNKEFDAEIYLAHEVRFGWNDEFEYVLCPHCGTLQIKKIPDDLGNYYDSDKYYSLSGGDTPDKNSFLKSKLRKHLLRYRMKGSDIIGRCIAYKEKNSFAWIERNLLDFNSSIIDIGCGTGRTILKLAQSGCTNVCGADPFLEKDIRYELSKNNIVNIYKKSVEDIATKGEKFDVVTLTNVMEHLDNPHSSLEAISKIMHSQSVLILYLPIFSNFTWNHYGIKMHQLIDAPRHLFIYSIQALENMAAQHNLKLMKIKPFFYYKVLQDVYGQTCPEIAAMDQQALIKDLLAKNEAAHAYVYFQLSNAK